MRNYTNQLNPAFSMPYLREQIRDYVLLSKFRLSILVVFSAAAAYCMASPSPYNWVSIFWLSFGGFLVTASANGLNQVFEREPDRLMERTKDRPVASGRMSVTHALIVCLLMGISGLIILGVQFHFQAFLLGLVAILSYAFVYTPLKRITPLSVAVGAVPGAIPPMLGYIAFTNEISAQAWVLFAIQFAWQFPHFWAIAWLLEEDYKKAGFKMMPNPGGNPQLNANTIFVYTLILLPLSFLPIRFEMAGIGALITLLSAALMMCWFAFKLMRNCSPSAAHRHRSTRRELVWPEPELCLLY